MMTNGQETAYPFIMDWYKNRSSLVYRLGGPAGSGKSWLIRLIAEAVGRSQHHAWRAACGRPDPAVAVAYHPRGR